MGRVPRQVQDMDSDPSAEGLPIDSVSTRWNCFGYKFPRREVVYFSQIVIIYIVILFCLVNLTFNVGASNIWVALLGSCLGYLLPQPSMEDGSFLRNASQ